MSVWTHLIEIESPHSFETSMVIQFILFYFPIHVLVEYGATENIKIYSIPTLVQNMYWDPVLVLNEFGDTFFHLINCPHTCLKQVWGHIKYNHNNNILPHTCFKWVWGQLIKWKNVSQNSFKTSTGSQYMFWTSVGIEYIFIFSVAPYSTRTCMGK
jgi:hypothetical protein